MYYGATIDLYYKIWYYTISMWIDWLLGRRDIAATSSCLWFLPLHDFTHGVETCTSPPTGDTNPDQLFLTTLWTLLREEQLTFPHRQSSTYDHHDKPLQALESSLHRSCLLTSALTSSSFSSSSLNSLKLPSLLRLDLASCSLEQTPGILSDAKQLSHSHNCSQCSWSIFTLSATLVSSMLVRKTPQNLIKPKTQ